MKKNTNDKDVIDQSDLVVRPMKASEVIKVAKFAESMIKSLSSCYSPPALKSELGKYKAEELKEKIKTDPLSILVATKNKEIVGFLLSKWDDATIWLEWIGVSEEERGKGLAQLLLKKLEETLPKRKAHKIWCDCRTNNQASIKFFKANGFKKITTIMNHWFKQDYILWQKVF